ncbi:MAG TPA: twin-arginine translocase TatA/TatE family subunit [Blastocatellia bacterium]|nr:twin-arginine translocase TatA/TatE family subunit [Blastocatellia bacterium]
MTPLRGESYNAAHKEIVMNNILLIGFGMQELLIILVILLFLFGGSRLPQLAKGLGESVKNFKKAVNEDKDDNDKSKAA